MSVHFEAFYSRDPAGVQWTILETEPFSGHYAFDCEEAALDKARRNDLGYGIRVDKVVTQRETVFTEARR